MDKIHLGDGAFVEYQDYTFILTTSNGIEDTNEIYLEINAMRALVDYARKCVKSGFNE